MREYWYLVWSGKNHSKHLKTTLKPSVYQFHVLAACFLTHQVWMNTSLESSVSALSFRLGELLPAIFWTTLLFVPEFPYLQESRAKMNRFIEPIAFSFIWSKIWYENVAKEWHFTIVLLSILLTPDVGGTWKSRELSPRLSQSQMTFYLCDPISDCILRHRHRGQRSVSYLNKKWIYWTAWDRMETIRTIYCLGYLDISVPLYR